MGTRKRRDTGLGFWLVIFDNDSDKPTHSHVLYYQESVFFFSECLSVFHWGRASDAYGRRPVLLVGPLGLTVAMFGFGLSKSFWSMVFFRAAQGIFNGNIGELPNSSLDIVNIFMTFFSGQAFQGLLWLRYMPLTLL